MVVAAGSHEYDEILGQPTDASILEDANRVRALREAVGPKIELMMDANKGATFAQFSDAAQPEERFITVASTTSTENS